MACCFLEYCVASLSAVSEMENSYIDFPLYTRKFGGHTSATAPSRPATCPYRTPRGPQQSCAVRYDTRHNRHDPGQLLRIAAVARRTSRGYVLRSVANPLDTVIIRPYPPLSAAICNNPTLQHVMNPPRIRGDPWHQKVNF